MAGIKTENFRKIEITKATELEDWLHKNFQSDDSFWLVTYKKSIPDKYVSRDEVLDNLVAFGWIDGLRRKIDDNRTMQLISKRKTQVWAATYKNRAKQLIDTNRMQAPGFESVISAQTAGTWSAFDDVDELEISVDLQDALDLDPVANAFFQSSSPSYRRNILRWLKKAKQITTRKRRISTIVDHCQRRTKIPNL